MLVAYAESAGGDAVFSDSVDVKANGEFDTACC